MVKSKCARSLKLTKDDENRIIDKTFHSYFAKNYDLVFMDGIMHFAVKNNPKAGQKPINKIQEGIHANTFARN